MKILLVYCHPNPGSFNHAIFETAKAALAKTSHEVQILDLYAIDFDPIMSCQERLDYMDNTQMNIDKVKDHVEKLEWADMLMFIFPTWFFGLPAMLKGWFERVWLPGVVFEVAEAKGKVTMGKLKNIKRVMVITTSGSPWWWLKVVKDPVKSFFKRGLRPNFNARVRYSWLQLFDMNCTNEADRKKFLSKVAKKVGKLK